MPTSHQSHADSPAGASRPRRGILLPGDIRRLVVFALTILVIVPGIAWMAGGFNDWSTAGWRAGSALVLLAFGVYAVKTRRLRTHARTMAILMIALVLMTLLSLMPGRLMHDVVFGG